MKKTRKHLSLRKETLRDLDARQITAVIGGNATALVTDCHCPTEPTAICTGSGLRCHM